MLQVILLFGEILSTCRGKGEKTVKVLSQFLSCFVIHFLTDFFISNIFIVFFGGGGSTLTLFISFVKS